MTRERLQVGRVEAVRRGAVVDWVVGNPEALPYASQSFDSVVSCLGVMLTPHHQTAANELLRVSMLGGRIGLLSWTPEGLMGRLAALVNRILPPPQTAALAPTLWGDEAYVLTLLGDRVTSVGPAATGTRSTASRTRESSGTSSGRATARPEWRTGRSRNALNASPTSLSPVSSSTGSAYVPPHCF